MPRVNRTSLFNTTLPWIGSTGRTHKVRRDRTSYPVCGARSPWAAGDYVMTGWDSGLGQWVIWGPFTYPVLAPAASITRPNYTGTLSKVAILTGP